MNDLAPVLVCAVFVYGVYRLFELFVRRKERMAIIERMLSGTIDTSHLTNQLKLPVFSKNNGSWTIRIGLLLLGIGMGIIIASIVDLLTENVRNSHGPIEILYSACAAVFGGIGLVIAYFIERKDNSTK